jgi:hypothetical protein
MLLVGEKWVALSLPTGWTTAERWTVILASCWGEMGGAILADRSGSSKKHDEMSIAVDDVVGNTLSTQIDLQTIQLTQCWMECLLCRPAIMVSIIMVIQTFFEVFKFHWKFHLRCFHSAIFILKKHIVFFDH